MKEIPTVRRKLFFLAIAAALSAGPSFAQDAEEEASAEESARDLETLVVTSTRRDQELSKIPRSVRVFDEAALASLQEQTNSVQEVLGKLIPGFAPPTTEASAASMTLRGRNPLYLIDGVPIATNTNFSRYLDKFDPMTIDRIEVVYGPTSLYGAGATGGVVQFFTKAPTTEGVEWNIGTQFKAYATGEDNFDSDGFQTKVYGSFSGAVSDRLSVYGYASYDDQGGIYRAEGDLLTGRSQFVDDVTLFGKARLQLTDTQALTLTLNSTELDYQDRSFELARTDAGDGTIIASEVAFPFSYGDPPTNEFFYASLDYTNEDFLGGRLSSQLYYSDSEFLNPGSDIRFLLQRFGGPFPDIFPGLWQTGQVVDEFGFRGQFTKSFANGWNIATGIDYNDADSESLLPISTEAGFDETGFFDAATQDIQRPPYTLDAVGLFVEAGYSVTDRLSLSGGLRWDEFDYEVIGPYDVVFAFQFPRGERPGGSGTADDFSYNVGLNYDLTDRTVIFANYSEGFTIPSLGFVGNNVPPGVPVSDSTLVEPVITDSIELGLRGSIGDLVYAAAAYYTESNFEATVAIDPTTGLALRNRAPVEIYGLEASGTWFATDRFSLSGSLTWVEGEIDPSDDGNQIDLSTQVVPPVKITVEPRFKISRKWDVFGQILYSGDRDEGFEAGTDANPAESFTVVDLGTDYRINDSMRFGAQITNLFNEEYIPPGEATFIPGRIFSGPGRAVNLTFDIVF